MIDTSYIEFATIDVAKEDGEENYNKKQIKLLTKNVPRKTILMKKKLDTCAICTGNFASSLLQLQQCNSIYKITYLKF